MFRTTERTVSYQDPRRSLLLRSGFAEKLIFRIEVFAPEEQNVYSAYISEYRHATKKHKKHKGIRRP